MNVFGGVGKTSRGARGLRGYPGRDALELCNYLPNTISRALRENEQDASFVFASPADCDIDGSTKKVKTWNNKRTTSAQNLVAVKQSTFSKIDETSAYALDFPGQYKTSIIPLNTSMHAFGYFCITFISTSDDVQTLLANKHGQATWMRQYHEITVTNSDISIYGYRDGKIVAEPIMHNTKKWTTFYLEWSAGHHVVQYTYTINNDPDSQGNFHFDQTKLTDAAGFTLGSRVDGSQPFSGQVHAIETYLSQHPIPTLIKNLVTTRQSIHHVGVTRMNHELLS